MKKIKNDLNRICCSGWSMFPTVKSGDSIYSKRIKRSRLKKGDLIVYKDKSLIVCHRLIGFDKNHFITRGDNLIHRDAPHKWEDFLGKVVIIRDEKGFYKKDQKTRRILICHFENIYSFFVQLKHFYYNQTNEDI